MRPTESTRAVGRIGAGTGGGAGADDEGGGAARPTGAGGPTRPGSPATSTGRDGTADYTDREGRHVIGGYDVIDDLHRVVTAEDEASTLLAPVNRQRHRSVLIVALGAVLAVGAAIAFGTREAQMLRRLADQTAKERY
jgi:hypothetical protein